MLCKILIINMLDYKFKRFIFNLSLIVPANAARFIMLININNGTTWQICRTKDDEVAFQLVY